MNIAIRSGIEVDIAERKVNIRQIDLSFTGKGSAALESSQNDTEG